METVSSHISFNLCGISTLDNRTDKLGEVAGKI